MERSGSFQSKKRVGRAANSDSEKGHGQDQSERKCRSTKKRSEHAVPNKLHQKEGEADQCGSAKNEPRPRRCVRFLFLFFARRFGTNLSVGHRARQIKSAQCDTDIQNRREPERGAIAEIFEAIKSA